MARIRTLLGNLFLEFPFRDTRRATREWEAAVESMGKHHDLDYVVKRIQALGFRLESARSARSGPDNGSIFKIHAALAFSQPLELTIRDVERAIVLAAVNLLGPSISGISTALQTGHDRIERYLREKRERKLPDARRISVSEGDDLIFEVSLAFAFSQPLEDTVQDIERAVILAACGQYGCDESALTRLLGIGDKRVRKHLEMIRGELQRIRYAV